MPIRLTDTELRQRNEMWNQGYLWCNKCKAFYPSKHFYKNRGKGQITNYGYRFYCKRCENHKKRNKAWAKQYHKTKNSSIKKQLIKLGGSRCQKCGYAGFYSAFDFHHVYPSEKVGNVVQIAYSKGVEGAWAELDKCCLLCRCCHAAYTGGEWRAEFVKREPVGYSVGKELSLNDDRYIHKPTKIEQSPLPIRYKQTKIKQLKLLER